jgi:basic membrane protein A
MGSRIGSSSRRAAARLILLIVASAVLAGALLGMARAAAGVHGPRLTTCVVTDRSTSKDRAFGGLAAAGMNAAERLGVGVTGHVVHAAGPAQYLPSLQACVRQGARITIGVGFLMEDAIDTVAVAYPGSKFAIVDFDVASLKHRPDNVEGLLFAEQQAGYLAGYAAGSWAKLKKAKTIAAVGEIKIPPVDRYIAGYEYGASKADPGVKTLHSYAQGAGDASACAKTASKQISSGSVIEFGVGDQCEEGVLQAAKQKAVFGIASDTDHHALGDYVLTSAVKRVDVAVQAAVLGAARGSFAGGSNLTFGAALGGIGLGRWSSKAPPSLRTALAKQLTLLKAGRIAGIPTVVE